MSKLKIISILSVLTLSACATGPRYGGNVQYGDEKGVEQVTNEFGSTDIGMIAESMSSKMLQFPVIANSKTVVRMKLDPVKNATSEYINTKIITDKIRKVLINSGKVEFAVGDDGIQSQTNDLRTQNQTGLYDSKTTAKVGKMEAAKYRVEGSISSIVKRGEVKDVWYTFSLNLIDVQRGVIVWTDDKDIRKTSGR